MRRYISMLLVAVVILSSTMVLDIQAETLVSVNVEGKNIEFPDVKPFIDDNNRTLVPVRFVSEALGADVKWNGNLRQVTVTYNNKVIKLVIDQKTITVDNQAQEMDTKAILKESRTFVPLRFVSEAMGADVEWDGANRTVVIKLKSKIINELKNLTRQQIIDELREYPYITLTINDNFFRDYGWLLRKKGSLLEDYMNKGKDYMETFYNVDYRTYDKESYKNNLKRFFLSSVKLLSDDDEIRTSEGHIDYWIKMIEEKQIAIETEFITDETLLYSNGDTMVRGRMLYKVLSCNDMDFLKNYTRYGDVELNKEYTCVVEVELANMLKSACEDWETDGLLVYKEHLITGIYEISND